MDFFYRNLEAAQEQALSLSRTASTSAKGFAEQLTEHTKTLADQAATASSAAAEQASQRWKDINIQEALQLKSLHTSSQAQKGTYWRCSSRFLQILSHPFDTGEETHTCTEQKCKIATYSTEGQNC